MPATHRPLSTLAALWIAAAPLFVASPGMAEICVATSLVEDRWDNEIAFNQCGTEKEARWVCNVWMKQCKKRVKAAAKCNVAQAKTEAAYHKALCKLERTLDPKGCLAGWTDVLKNRSAEIKERLKKGQDDCEDTFESCVRDC